MELLILWINLNKNLEILDFSNNYLGDKSLNKIWSWIESHTAMGTLNLKFLKICNSKLVDNTLMPLMEWLRICNPDLVELDLSQNKIGDKSWKILSSYLENAYSMVKVNLKWNQISSQGCIKLWEGILKGNSIKNLNLSYNWLGRNDSIEFLQSIVSIINSTLVHLDISHNNLSLPIWRNLGELIENNHSLYGLHIHGNDWYIDGFGFIRVGVENQHFEYSKSTIISPSFVTGFSKAIKFTSK